MNKNIINNSTLNDFFDALKDMRGIESINRHLLDLIFQFQNNVSEATQKFFVLCFSLMDDGNSRLPMSFENFSTMWQKKWNGLVQLCISEGDSSKSSQDYAQASDFAEIIRQGITDILSNDYSNIIQKRNEALPLGDNEFSKPFILANLDGSSYIYFTKHFNAKCIIEQSAKRLFKDGNQPGDNEISQCIEAIGNMCNPIKKKNEKGETFFEKFLINKEQASAILRGQSENLIITGGPGTGKTTVVLYILWNLLQNHPEMLNWNIYLAAPSGKAADRMGESLRDGLSHLTEEVKSHESGKVIFKALNDLGSTTIHRLLKFSHSEGGFRYNKNTPFPKDSIFVIDEASMIDIELFAALLQAIPEEARLFILGDPFQLPSVDSGAVLGEILKPHNASKNFFVKLIKSNRFQDDSKIKKLADEIKIVAETKDASVYTPHKFEKHPALSKPEASDTPSKDITDSHGNFATAPQEEPSDIINYFAIKGDAEPRLSKKETEARLKEIVEHWIGNFRYLPQLAEKINPNKTGCEDPVNESGKTSETENRDTIWQLSLQQRMLSAERRSACGVENLNKWACSAIRKFSTQDNYDQKYFPGQLLIITQNQEMFKLYNGDTGIVVFDDNTPYIMLKKSPTKDSSARRDDYVFYPIAVLPEESLESAFAITIHKSQGSEYKHVTMFLPKQKGHPLLTNQILYTGITRAKKSVTIIATDEAFQAACCTVTERETGIEL